METYEKARMEIIEFETEDVITTSCPGDTRGNNPGGSVGGDGDCGSFNPFN